MVVEKSRPHWAHPPRGSDFELEAYQLGERTTMYQAYCTECQRVVRLVRSPSNPGGPPTLVCSNCGNIALELTGSTKAK